jgi:hypothetical protein
VIQNATAAASSAGLRSWIPETPEREAAWEAILALLRPGGRPALPDLVMPLVWLGCRFFAADWTR